MLALVGAPAQQRITSVVPKSQMTTMEHSTNYSAAELAYERLNVDGETPEHAAPRGPPVDAALASMRAPSPNDASHWTDRMSALDVTSSLERTTSKEQDSSPLRMERKRHGRVTVRHHGWRPRYQFAFLRIW